MDGAIRLYHGSKGGLQGAIRPVSDSASDFGSGFYMGDEMTQPQTLICEDPNPVLYALDFDLEGLNVLRFKPDVEWALFVAFNRGKLDRFRGKAFYERFRKCRDEADVIFGKIANDKMFYVLDFFFDNLASDTAVEKCLSALNLGDQYCAKTVKACRAVSIVDQRPIGSGECRKLQERSERQRVRAAAIVDEIMDSNRRDGLLFREILEKKAEELCA